jgi:hypothetical protein
MLELTYKHRDREQEMTENYQDWTSCEIYGHKFEDGTCIDCDEKIETEDLANE